MNLLSYFIMGGDPLGWLIEILVFIVIVVLLIYVIRRLL